MNGVQEIKAKLNGHTMEINDNPKINKSEDEYYKNSVIHTNDNK